MLARSIIGSPDTVCSDMDALIAVTGADKLLILSDVYGHATRRNLSSPAPEASLLTSITLAARSA